MTTTRSDKPFKIDEHRSERRTAKTKLASGREDEIPHPKVFGNPWAAPKDGKQWIDPNSKWMRK
jgi:hypothetical protein